MDLSALSTFLDTLLSALIISCTLFTRFRGKGK